MSTDLLLLLFTGFLSIVYSDTHICDDSNLVCYEGTVNCMDNELCLIKCIGSQHCRGTTINCPLNGDCIVECYTSSTERGCRSSIIDASKSLSLLVNNSNINDQAFQGVDIYCPYNGTCSLISDNNAIYAFSNAQIHSIFGFIWKQFSVSCNGMNCNEEMVMNCGDQYTLSSCIIDTNTGNSCDGGGICDTIYTSISGTWTDDYQINPAPGWIITDYNGNTINSTFDGSLSTYYGPYYGNEIQNNSEIYTLIRYFYCSYTASVFVKYYYAFGCQQYKGYSRLYLNNILKADKHSQAATGHDFQDIALFNYCSSAWNQKSLNGSLDVIPANTLFKVQIDIALNWQHEASVISLLEITCIPTIMSPTSLQPTYAPITVKLTSSPTVQTASKPITVKPTVPTASEPTIANASVNVTGLSNPTRATLQYKTLYFICYYNDDAKFILNSLSYPQYAQIMVDAVLYSIKSITLEWTAGENEGIFDFIICNVFDFELIIESECPSYSHSANDDAEYIAVGTFEIAVNDAINTYKKQIIDIMTSDEFKNKLTQNMNDKINNKTINRRMLLKYNSFEAIAVDIIDPLNKSVTDSDEENMSSIFIVIVICVIIIIVIYCIIREYNKTENVSEANGGYNDIENNDIENNDIENNDIENNQIENNQIENNEIKIEEEHNLNNHSYHREQLQDTIDFIDEKRTNSDGSDGSDDDLYDMEIEGGDTDDDDIIPVLNKTYM